MAISGKASIGAQRIYERRQNRVATMPSDFLVRELGITAHDTNHDLVAEMRQFLPLIQKKERRVRRARMRSGRKGGAKG